MFSLLITGLGPPLFLVCARLRQQYWFTIKSGFTMVVPSYLVPLGKLWVRRRGLQPLGFGLPVT